MVGEGKTYLLAEVVETKHFHEFRFCRLIAFYDKMGFTVFFRGEVVYEGVADDTTLK